MPRVHALIANAGFLIAGDIALTVGGLAIMLGAVAPRDGTEGLVAALALAAGIALVAAFGAVVIALRCLLGGVDKPAATATTPDAG